MFVMASNQRPIMGPPETPSRFLQQSPNLFPSLQFSPDLYAHQFPSGPATAPIYPQQRLFWDSSTMPFEEPTLPLQYQDPFQMSPASFSTSFASSSTIVPTYSQPDTYFDDQTLELPNMPRASSFTHVDHSGYPAPFTTSPRIPPPQMENPSMFLSSPARRFGGPDQTFGRPGHHAVVDRPAYSHQKEESRRELEMKRLRRMDVKQPSITRSVMEALKRPVSPKRDSRPGLKRSLTHTGVRGDRSLKLQTQTPNGRRSPMPGEASRGFLPGKSSPLKGTADPISRTLATSRNANTKRGSLALAIDENGVAKTVLTESQAEPDFDDAISSTSDSFDEADFHMIHSQHNSFAFHDGEDGGGANYSLNQRAYNHSKTSSHSTMGSTASARQSHNSSQSSYANGFQGDFQSNRRKRPLPGRSMQDDVLMEDESFQGNAQAALRAIIQDRSRGMATSEAANYPQLHSSPPLIQSQYAMYQGSPTTITDPDLATPSTDRDSIASNMSTRCVCHTTHFDGQVPVIQW